MMPAIRRISFIGVAVGGVVDVVATYALAFPLMMYASSRLGLPDQPNEQQFAALMHYMQDNTYIKTLGVGLWSLGSLLGGYVAARIARRAELLNGALSAYLSVFLGLAFIGSPSDYAPISVHLALVPVSVALGALGGAIRRSGLRRASPPNDTQATAVPSR